jgi:hypothetical protein
VNGRIDLIRAKEGQFILALSGCEAISEEAMTYAMSTQLKRWNMDYLSLRADPPAEPMQE